MESQCRGWLCLTVAASALLCCPGCGTSRTVVGGDAAPDAVVAADQATGDLDHDAAEDLTADTAATADMNLGFPAVLEGVWLVGWSGGMNHFSWVRFARMSTRTPIKKDAWILDGKSITANLSLWDCSGKATYWMGAALNTIYLDLPSTSCLPGGLVSPGYIFSNFDTSGAGAPKDAILSATVQVQSTLQQLNGYKFPDTWCDKAMTSCKAPF